MPITIACPSCKARLQAPDNTAGKRVKCPKCQNPIPVPAAGGTPAPAPAKQPAAAPSKPPVKKPAPPPDNDFNFDDDPPAPKKGAAPAKKAPPRDDDDDDPDERPAPRKGAAPARKPAPRDEDDDYDDEPPPRKGAVAKKKPVDDDEDFDDEPRSKKGGKKGAKADPYADMPEPSEEEKSNAFMIYVAAIVTGFLQLGPIGGIIWWLIKKGDSKFVDHHGKEFLNLNITGFLLSIVLVGLGVCAGVGSAMMGESGWIVGVAIGGIAFLIAMVFGLTWMVCFFIAMFKAKGGQWYRFPLVIHLLKVKV